MVATRTSLDSLYSPGCTFCPDNGKIKVLQTSPNGNTVFVQTMVKRRDVFVPATGAYFVIPVEHFKPQEDMPFDFLHEVNWHVRESGLEFDNAGFNLTEEGGAKILDHAHYWLMQVGEGDPALGLYSLREDFKRLKSQGACFRACP